jgi:SAM-dependent methyltransferase
MNNANTHTIGKVFDAWQPILEMWHKTERVADADMYRGFHEQSGGPSLELGIGDGRVAAVVEPTYGVDLSYEMLRKCRERMGERTPILLNEDFTDFAVANPLRLTYSPLNTLNHVPPEARNAVFRNVFSNTLPGGLFVFDSRVPDPEVTKRYNKVPMLNSRTLDYVIHQTSVVVDPVRNELELHVSIEVLGEDGQVVSKRYLPPLPFYEIYPKEFESLAITTGWNIKACWGDLTKRNFRQTAKFRSGC